MPPASSWRKVKALLPLYEILLKKLSAVVILGCVYIYKDTLSNTVLALDILLSQDADRAWNALAAPEKAWKVCVYLNKGPDMHTKTLVTEQLTHRRPERNLLIILPSLQAVWQVLLASRNHRSHFLFVITLSHIPLFNSLQSYLKCLLLACNKHLLRMLRAIFWNLLVPRIQ